MIPFQALLGIGFPNLEGIILSAAGFWAAAFTLLTLVVYVAFAVGVYRDAEALTEPPSFVAPWAWAAATLLGGLITPSGGLVILIVYWAVHHSTLSRRSP